MKTTLMGLTYPAEDESKWYYVWETFMGQIDSSLFASIENSSLILSGGGVISLSSENVLSWSESFELLAPNSGGKVTIGSGSLDGFVDGSIAYVEVTRPLNSAIISTMSKANVISGSADANKIALVIRRGDKLIIKDSVVTYGGGSWGIGNDVDFKGNVSFSVCEDDSTPSIDTVKSNSISMIRTGDLYEGLLGNDSSGTTRDLHVFASSFAPSGILKRNGLIEGCRCINPDNEYYANTIGISPGVAYVGGRIVEVDSYPIISDVFASSQYGGLTNEARSYLAANAAGNNCIWLYVWMRKDGTFWFEPWGPETKMDGYVWCNQSLGDWFHPSTYSGLPQTSFSVGDYTLVDVVWLANGNASSGTGAVDALNIRTARFIGGGYRHFDNAVDPQSETIIDHVIVDSEVFSTGEFRNAMKTLYSTSDKTPGIPVGVTNRARIYIGGQVTLGNSSHINIQVGNITGSAGGRSDLYKPTIDVGSGNILDGCGYGIDKETGASETAEVRIGQFVDVEVDVSYSAGIGGAYLPWKMIVSGSVSGNLKMCNVGFYWNRFEKADRDI